jgi:DNA-binding PadR family transcriptional regulator
MMATENDVDDEEPTNEDLGHWGWARGSRGRFRHEHHEGFPPPSLAAWGDWGFGGRGFGGRGGPGRHRARRGDIPVGILQVLSEQPMHGYELIREIEARSGGAWHPSPGSIYPHLQLFQDSGFVTSQEVDGKRIYSITDAGRAKLAEATERLGDETPWDFAREGAREGKRRYGRLFGEVQQLMAAVGQVARAGNEEKVEQVAQLLAEARKKVYGLLAED